MPGDKADKFCKENPISDEEAAKYQHIGFQTAGGYADDFAEALAQLV